jgi:oligo-1,6-glucosidase
VSRFGTDDPAYRVRSAKLLATVLHLHRGTPYVYQGEELGMTNYPFTAREEFRDIESLNYYTSAMGAGHDEKQVLASLRAMSRDNARTPMQWDGSAHAGFTTGTPWLAVNPNYRDINAADQITDPGSVFSHYRQLNALRHNLPVVVAGDFTMLVPDDEHVYAFTRRLDDVELLVVANFSDEAATVDLPGAHAWADAELLLSNYPGETGPAAGTVTLRAWEARVHKRACG